MAAGGFDIRKSFSELKQQLRHDIRELAGSRIEDSEEEKGWEKREVQKDVSAISRDYLENGTHQKGLLLDTRRWRTRLARAVAISAVTIYAWMFAAHPAAFAGFGVALFDLFVGLGSLSVLARRFIAELTSGRKSAGVSSVRAVPSWIERTQAYRWARREFQERLRLAASGVALSGSSTTRARKYLNALFASAPAIVMAAGLASATVHPYFILLAVVPGIIIAVPFLSLKLKRAERKELDDELPFFLILAEMFALVEKPLIHAFEALARKDLLPKVRREAEIARRDVNAFGYTPELAIDGLAKSHPNAEFRTLLHGYLGSVSLGQSPAQYFQNKAETYLARLESRYERFRENAGTAGEVMLIALMIVPITGLMYGASGGVPDVVLVMTIPLMAVGVFFMLDRAQVKGPQGRARSRLQILPVAAGAAAAVISLALLQSDLVTALLLSVAAFAIPHGIVVRRRIRHEDTLLSELAEFVRAVAEGMKTGLDVTSAIRHTGVDRFRSLRPHVKRMKYGIATGGTLESSSVLAGSGFYIRYVMFIMSVLAASGAASYAMLDRLAEYLGRVREQSAKVKKSVAVYGFLIIASPLFMMFTVHAMESISSFTSSGVPVGGSGLSIPAMQMSSNPVTIKMMLLLTTLCAGALGGKVSNQTLMDTLPLGMACIIALVSPTLLSIMWPVASPLPVVPGGQ